VVLFNTTSANKDDGNKDKTMAYYYCGKMENQSVDLAKDQL